MRPVIQLAYKVRRMLLGVLRIRTTGVKVMVFNGSGQLLLIRNSYGDTAGFLLPGGGVSKRESPAAAAIREVREELGLEIRELEPVSTYESLAEGKRDSIHLFRALTHLQPRADEIEVVEARFFDLNELPEKPSPATRRRIVEIRGERPYEGIW